MVGPEPTVGAGGGGQTGRFRPGDRVRVAAGVRGGNPRTPRYLRGWTGTVAHCHGVVDNPLDHHDPYPPLYSVVFLLPGSGDPPDEVLADLHEEWLADATDRTSGTEARPGR